MTFEQFVQFDNITVSTEFILHLPKAALAQGPAKA